MGVFFMVSSSGVKIPAKGEPGGWPHLARWVGGAARGQAAPPGRLGQGWPPSGPSSGSGTLLVRGFSLFFMGIFRDT